MIGEVISFTLRNLPALLLLLAVAIAIARRNSPRFAEHFLGWVLLLPIGITSLWAGIFHVLFPATAASYIGWQVSPFHRGGYGGFGLGVTATWASWRDLNFKAAAVLRGVDFSAGDAAGHVRQMVTAGNSLRATREFRLHGHSLSPAGDCPVRDGTPFNSSQHLA